MILTLDEVRDAFCTELGCFDYRESLDDPWPPEHGNTFSIWYKTEDGKFEEAWCENMRHENYEVLARIQPDTQITVNGNRMRVTDPRVGPEWLAERDV